MVVPTFAARCLAPDHFLGLARAGIVVDGGCCVGVVGGFAAEAEGLVGVAGGHSAT